ncbi:MAG: galactose-1-epimerase, partial [Clostridiales bacterium]|nr:galactose-1-epimerase [Clostridiales bacterium]
MIMNFGKLKDGRQASLHILRNAAGIEAHVTDYGAALVRLLVPDRDGNMRDVVLGHDDVSGYENGSGSVGATVGRFANRIGGAAFTIDGREYHLTANNGPNAL